MEQYTFYLWGFPSMVVYTPNKWIDHHGKSIHKRMDFGGTPMTGWKFPRGDPGGPKWRGCCCFPSDVLTLSRP